eukprot:3050133-Amphidinium_carterae.1
MTQPVTAAIQLTDVQRVRGYPLPGCRQRVSHAQLHVILTAVLSMPEGDTSPQLANEQSNHHRNGKKVDLENAYRTPLHLGTRLTGSGFECGSS